jgi:hypothetical protein
MRTAPSVRKKTGQWAKRIPRVGDCQPKVSRFQFPDFGGCFHGSSPDSMGPSHKADASPRLHALALCRAPNKTAVRFAAGLLLRTQA